MFDVIDDEMIEISERMIYSVELVGNDILMEEMLFEDKIEEYDVFEDRDNKFLYFIVIVVVGIIMVFFVFFIIKYNFFVEVIGNLLLFIFLVFLLLYCFLDIVSKFKNYFKKFRNLFCVYYYCFFCL